MSPMKSVQRANSVFRYRRYRLKRGDSYPFRLALGQWISRFIFELRNTGTKSYHLRAMNTCTDCNQLVSWCTCGLFAANPAEAPASAAAPQQETEPSIGSWETDVRCPTCNGNDGEAPCAYPGENAPGCLRTARLKQDVDARRDRG